MSSPDKNPPTPLETDAEILAQVVYASPTKWGTTPEEILLGQILESLFVNGPDRMHLLAWPDGVRAMLPSAAPICSPELNQAVVNTYRAAASGCVGPVVVGEGS